MRDLKNFGKTECEDMEAEIREMCGKIKLVAPPSKFSLEEAVEKIVRESVNLDHKQAIRTRVAAFLVSLSEAFTTRRLANAASSVIVLMMVMIIPLALFSHTSMAMNHDYARREGAESKAEKWKLVCTKDMCGDKKYQVETEGIRLLQAQTFIETVQ